MKSVLMTVLVLGLMGGGLWWFADQRNTRIAAENEASRLAAEAAVRDERVGLYGEEALAGDIIWTDTGLGIKHLVEGKGARPIAGGYVSFGYRVRLKDGTEVQRCLLYTSPSPRDRG